jgi:hypothetical protein
MHLQERWITNVLDHISQGFRLIRFGQDQWGIPLVSGHTCEATTGNGPRITAKFTYNEVEEEIAIWLERPSLTRDMISSFVCPKNREAYWELFDQEGNQVEVKDFRNSSHRIQSEATLVLVTNAHIPAVFDSSGDGDLKKAKV